MNIVQYCIVSDNDVFAEDLESKLVDFSELICVNRTSYLEEAMNIILKEKPEIVFIDLDSTSFNQSPFHFINELHQYIEVLPFIIGASKVKEFAYQSFKCNFSDYLLKPTTECELRKSIMRLKKKMISRNKKVCFKSYSDYHFLNNDEVNYLKADNNTTDIYLTNGTKLTAFDNLKYFENHLEKNFSRIHHSYIVNIFRVRRINFGKSKVYLLSDTNLITVPFSRGYKENVKRIKSMILKPLLN